MPGAQPAQGAVTQTVPAPNLAATEPARQSAEQRLAAELATASARLADREARYQTAMARAARICRTLEQRVLELDAALRQSEQRRATDTAAAVDHLARRHAEFTASLTQAARSRDALAEQLSAARAALCEAAQVRTAEAAAAADRLARREAELGAALAEAATARIALEQKLAQADAALKEAEQRARHERAAGERAAAERETELQERLTRQVAAHKAVEHDLAETRATLEQSRQEASAAAAQALRLAQREAELGAALAESAAARRTLEGRLAETELQRQQEGQRAAVDLAASAARQAELESRLAHETATRSNLEQAIVETRMAAARARRRLLDVAAAIRRRTREHRARLEARLELERADHEHALGSKTEDLRQLESERDSLQQALASTQQQLQGLSDTLDDERQQHEHDRATHESAFQQLSADLDQARQSLDRVSAAFDTLERVSSEHAAERARLEGLLADRDADLSAQAARQLASEQSASAALAQLQETLELAREDSRRDIARREAELEALRQELEGARNRSEQLQKDADQVPGLLEQLENSQRDNRRQFDRAPYGMCRCTRDGAITDVNRSLVRLLGYRTGNELRQVDFASAVFESEADLRWLFERAVSTGQTDWVETTWRRKDRSRLAVRLQLQPRADASVDILVEDVTTLRDAEERLRQAQRMEAVGRLASEVAATCDSLLRDAILNGRQWLAGTADDIPFRQQGEQVLGEVRRAASYLQQLNVYGQKQVSALEPVNVQRILRDLEPVLKRVAGDDIELVLSKVPASVDVVVDVEAERVERVLVNVASYARERMPHGGRVKIDLATTIVDRRFVARYPNVRPGAHLLITVTEAPGPDRPGPPIDPAAEPAPTDASRAESVRPGVDLGALLGLVGECGGHVWMAVEPPGNMTLKIHLPNRARRDAVEAGAPVPRGDRGGEIARTFRH